MDSTRLAQIRKDYYVSTRRQVEAILGQERKDLKNYRQQYERELSRYSPTAADRRHFMSRLKKADLVLVGDFHALKQSSRMLLRLLRKEAKPICLGLECLDVSDQAKVEQFLRCQIAEKDFLKAIEWKKKWGFPWENYRPLFKWAQATGSMIFGLSDYKIKELKKRDLKSAQIIESEMKKNKEKKFYIQYGDLHLASSHLPKEIKKLLPKTDICVIFQSPEIIYFNFMTKQKEHQTDVVRLSADHWAVNNVPPWVKWQDYLLYLESGQDKRIRIEESDITDRVGSVVTVLANSYGLKVDLSSLSVYSSSDDTFFNQIEKLSAPIRKRLLELAQEGYSFYVPEIESGFLARFSINHVATIASQYIYYKEGQFLKTIVDPRKDFLKLIWFEMITYLGVKVTNPKRKSDTLHDIRLAIQKEQFDDRGKEALSIALAQKLDEMQFLSSGRIKRALPQKSATKKSLFLATQILGAMMGEKFFYALTKRIIKLPQNKKLIFKNISKADEGESFRTIYYESLEMIESWPEGFKSKFDKL